MGTWNRLRGFLTMDRTKTVSEITSHLVGAVAIVIGAFWTYSQFTIHRENVPTVQLLLSTRVIEIGDKQKAILVDVSLKNIGKVVVKPSSAADQFGMPLWVKEYDAANQGYSDTQGLVDWSRGGGKQRYVVDNYNLLELYEAYPDRYLLGPGLEFHETCIVPVKSGKMYCINARFYASGGGSTNDMQYVYVD